jgi:C4-dicarboxylate-specific signal transduction histidine kinase
MKLRLILLVLSLLAFLSTAVGGYLYYYSLKESAFQEAAQQAEIRVEMLRINLSTMISANVQPARILAGMPSIIKILQHSDPSAMANANAILDHFQVNLGADVCYLMDQDGLTIASSNRQDRDSFVGIQLQLSALFQGRHESPADILSGAWGRPRANAAPIAAVRFMPGTPGRQSGLWSSKPPSTR